MFYLVKFSKSNSIGTIKSDWMIGEGQCKYPTHKPSKQLSMESDANVVKWKIYDCELLYPKVNGAEGYNTLAEAIAKEKFYEKYSDTEDYENQTMKQELVRLHPTIKFSTQIDLNKLITQTNVEEEKVRVEKVNDNFENRIDPSAFDVTNEQSADHNILRNDQSPLQNTNEIENIQSSLNQDNLNIYSQQSEVLAEFFQQAADSSTLNDILQKLEKISSKNEENFEKLFVQNNEIIKELISLQGQLNKIEARMEIMEMNSNVDIDITDFSIELIKCVDDLNKFSKRLQSEQVFYSKCVKYLNKNCPKGNARKAHNGIVKAVIYKLFSMSFINICGWSTEKGKNTNTSFEQRIYLSEYKAFLKLLLDVLNFNSSELFTFDHVAEGIKELFKRYTRKNEAESTGCQEKSNE